MRSFTHFQGGVMSTKTEGRALAEAARAQCTLLRDFMQNSARPYVDRFAQATPEHATVKGAFLRVLAWLHTLSRLDDPGDFQAVCSGTRALYEIVVDLVLLTHDSTNYPASKILAWEEWAKLRQAEKVVRHYQGRELPEEYRHIQRFVDEQGPRIRQVRAATWPDARSREPERWTGNHLHVDAEHADRFGDYGLKNFHVDRFSQLCWSTHGSGLAGVRLIPPSLFDGVAAVPMNEASHFGFVACELTLDYFPETRGDAIVFERLRALAETGASVARDTLARVRRIEAAKG
ncbi:MAG: hypothetical protein JST00_20020 [Deltaproteobacteria bacterium]|nr:hypothetical protein [Deltaproteobacteria bacterium]